jgi:predicted Zn-dependent protease
LHDLAECVWDAIENTEMIKAKERNNYQNWNLYFSQASSSDLFNLSWTQISTESFWG